MARSVAVYGTTMAEKEMTVRRVIQSLRKYLYEELTIHEDLLIGCEGSLLEMGTVAQIRALLKDGKHSEAVTKCLQYIEGFYIMETLEKFVDLLQELSQKHAAYGRIAKEFHRVMGRSMYSSCETCRYLDMLYIVCFMHDHWRNDLL